MLYDRSLEIFKAVAELKSFSRAAESLHITHTAIIRQINNLESEMDVKLFDRTFHGVSLTPAGESFYEDVLHILSFSETAVLRAREIAKAEQFTIRIGSSLLCPSDRFNPIWNAIHANHPEYNLIIVPYDDAIDFNKLLNHDFDFVLGTYDDYYKEEFQVQVIPVGRYHYYVAVPKNHPLTRKKAVRLRDLDNEHLVSVALDVSENLQSVRNLMKKVCPHMVIEKLPSDYSIIHVANYCANNNCIMLTLECWTHIHPSLVYIPIEDDLSFPYGIITSRVPNQNMKRFIPFIEEVLESEEEEVE